MDSINCDVNLISGHLVQLSYIDGLIMLHTATANCQWQPNTTAIELTKTDEVVKIGFYCNSNCHTYQSWFFDISSASNINKFFTRLGYNGFDENNPINSPDS